MKKYACWACMASVSAFGLLPAYGQEITFDVGKFSCSPTASAFPVQASRTRTVAVTAKIFVTPSNDSTKNSVRACAEQVKGELDSYNSPSNMQLFNETFQHYLEACTRQANSQVRSVRSILVADNRCY
jgi:hypothetical protein